jgi:hypothetical protein
VVWNEGDKRMTKETLEKIIKRHGTEIREFQKNCKHEHAHVFKGNMSSNSGWTRIDNFSQKHFTIGEGQHYDSIMLKCVDCGTPLLSYEHGKISSYVKPHYLDESVKKEPA